MSREIKFRAWSNEHNRYCDFVTLDENGKWIGWIKISGVYLTTADIILEQFTGLLDQNGKEICEGDIVTDKFEMKFEIIAHPTWKKLVLYTRKLNMWFEFSNNDFHPSRLKVIGNIHENPELLEKGKQP